MGGLSRRDRILASLVPLVLVIVASWQVATALTDDLTPWKGGGFGMFATADHLDTRVLRSYLASAGAVTPVEHEATIEMALQHGEQGRFSSLRAHPTSRHATAWANLLADRTWKVEDGVARLAEDDDLPARSVVLEGTGVTPIDGVRIEVWRSGYDRRKARIVPELVAVHDVPVAPR